MIVPNDFRICLIITARRLPFIESASACNRCRVKHSKHVRLEILGLLIFPDTTYSRQQETCIMRILPLNDRIKVFFVAS